MASVSFVETTAVGKFAVLDALLPIVTSLISPSSTSGLPEVGSDALGARFTLYKSALERDGPGLVYLLRLTSWLKLWSPCV